MDSARVSKDVLVVDFIIISMDRFGYPWDIWKGTIAFVAADNTTITESGRPGSGVFIQSGSSITDSILYSQFPSHSVQNLYFMQKL